MIARLLLAIVTSILVLVLLAGWLLAGWWPWPIALGLSVMLMLGIHATILGIEFMLTWWLGRDSRPDSPYEMIDCGPRWLAWLREIPAALWCFCCVMPWLGNRPMASGRDPDKAPVLLIHGYFCNRAVFRSLARDLAKAGHRVGSVNLEPPMESIDLFTATIEDAVQALLAESGASRVTLIGHSMGGLAIRAWLRDYGDARMQRVLTLGTPHQGTRLARIGHVPIVRQMQPGNAWLLALAAGEGTERTSRFITLLAEHDNIVTPQFPQTLPGATVIVFRGIGHLDLAWHRLARQVIVDRSRRPVSSAPLK